MFYSFICLRVFKRCRPELSNTMLNYAKTTIYCEISLDSILYMCIICSVLGIHLALNIGIIIMLDKVKTVIEDTLVGLLWLVIPVGIIVGVIFILEELTSESTANIVLLTGVVLYASYMIGTLKTKSYLK